MRDVTFLTLGPNLQLQVANTTVVASCKSRATCNKSKSDLVKKKAQARIDGSGFLQYPRFRKKGNFQELQSEREQHRLSFIGLQFFDFETE